jgi:hypothetical protein
MQLKHGPIVADTAIALAIDLERRGHVMLAADGTVRITNGKALTDQDRAAIVREKVFLVTICEYIASGAYDAER